MVYSTEKWDLVLPKPVSSGDPNSGPHDRTASILTTGGSHLLINLGIACVWTQTQDPEDNLRNCFSGANHTLDFKVSSLLD